MKINRKQFLPILEQNMLCRQTSDFILCGLAVFRSSWWNKLVLYFSPFQDLDIVVLRKSFSFCLLNVAFFFYRKFAFLSLSLKFTMLFSLLKIWTKCSYVLLRRQPKTCVWRLRTKERTLSFFLVRAKHWISLSLLLDSSFVFFFFFFAF